MTKVRKILIIDDDADVRESLVEHFALHDGIEAVAVGLIYKLSGAVYSHLRHPMKAELP